MVIEKEPGNPKLHKWRVIHIYETHYNLILGVKDQQLIHHMTDNSLFKDGVYSNQPGFRAKILYFWRQCSMSTVDSPDFLISKQTLMLTFSMIES